MKRSVPSPKRETPFRRFERLAKKIVAVPKDRIRERGKRKRPS